MGVSAGITGFEGGPRSAGSAIDTGFQGGKGCRMLWDRLKKKGLGSQIVRSSVWSGCHFWGLMG